MTTRDLKSYSEALWGCRFCPMCKPAGEVPNLTLIESHTTRARAMMLWRVQAGLSSWTPRAVEVLYQSTLDSISEAWCVSHYPVSEYMSAARAEVWAAGLAPEPVRSAVGRLAAPPALERGGKVLLLASEAAEIGARAAAAPALAALQRIGLDAGVVVASAGSTLYSLGARSEASEQASLVVDAVRQSGATTLVADGAQALWALRVLYPALGIQAPEGMAVTSLAELLAEAVGGARAPVGGYSGRKVLMHDTRAACGLGDSMARVEAIQPGYHGPEGTMGEGSVYEAPRRVVDITGAERLYSAWTRSLSRSCGADDGLWLTYPDLAAGLGKQTLREATELGADVIVTDSLLCARHLEGLAGDGGPAIKWLPELLDR